MFISNSAAETIALGRDHAQNARAGDVFALSGDLGAGKTQFVKGFVAGLACPADVTSPTFTLVHEYTGGRLPIYHFDFYRLDRDEAVLRLGFDDYADGDGVCLIEWADLFPEVIPDRARWISFEIKEGDARVLQESKRP